MRVIENHCHGSNDSSKSRKQHFQGRASLTELEINKLNDWH